jgi:hypothetical protein
MGQTIGAQPGAYDPDSPEERRAFIDWAGRIGIWDENTLSIMSPGHSSPFSSPTLEETFAEWAAIRASGKIGQINCIVCAGSGKLWPADDTCHACHGIGHWPVPAR